jgi:serine/threonine-protein kinase
VNSTPDPVSTRPAGDIGAGQVLGRYELLMPIGAGGMAMVWAARLKGSRGFEKIVAIKTMLPKLSEDEQFESMFLEEARLASQIRHPHVVEVLDLGEQDGVLFLVMEWIEGAPLNQLMKAARQRGGVPIPIAVRIAMQACAGLHAAHELKDRDGHLVGLVHRDVSPQNILVTYDGVTKVVDFGVAKATAIGAGATVAGQIKGKVAYMAPEQIKGSPLNRRVDLFALGIVLYALTTGKHPFRRESEAATMYNICSPRAVVPPRKVKANFPPQLERILIQALAKDPDRRYRTASDMLRALDQLPAVLRASTDDEVGQVVRELLGERREKRRQALDEAIERANKNPLALADWTGVEGRSLQRGALASFSKADLGSTGAGTEYTGPMHGTGATGTLTGQWAGHRTMVLMAVITAAALLAVGIVLSWGAGVRWAQQAPRPTSSASASPAPDQASSASKDPEPDTGAEEAARKAATDAAATISLEDLPTVEAPKPQSRPQVGPAPGWVGRGPTRAPAPGGPAKPAQGSASTKDAGPSWKLNPGF